ncbi:hypothetical protein ACH49_01730 [Streptomyces leeuwenhoekii]|uniref:Uncharacterized protein n=1 Tax=Streptomyces leeuwenhoekii TaxID=1437453 RepID=A0ABR5I562_STRLW|nr:hypothetical protein ACH49_01730 [Streptomyces leeuwenhoekii]
MYLGELDPHFLIAHWFTGGGPCSLLLIDVPNALAVMLGQLVGQGMIIEGGEDSPFDRITQVE